MFPIVLPLALGALLTVKAFLPKRDDKSPSISAHPLSNRRFPKNTVKPVVTSNRFAVLADLADAE